MSQPSGAEMNLLVGTIVTFTLSSPAFVARGDIPGRYRHGVKRPYLNSARSIDSPMYR